VVCPSEILSMVLASSFDNANLSAGLFGSAFFSRSRNRANCLCKNRFSAARAQTATPDRGAETQAVTGDRAQVPNQFRKLTEDVKHPCNRLTANSLIPRIHRIYCVGQPGYAGGLLEAGGKFAG
jgi:hypothetical protein